MNECARTRRKGPLRGYEYKQGMFALGIGHRKRWPFVWLCFSSSHWGARLEITIASGPLCLTIALPSFRIEYEGRGYVVRDGMRRKWRNDEGVTTEEWRSRWHFFATHGGWESDRWPGLGIG